MALELEVQYSLQGFKELDQALAKLPDLVQIEVLGLAVAKGAEVIRQGMARRAPRLTGRLAEGMIFTVAATRTGIMALIGPGGPTKKKVAFWGLFQEFGTVHHGARPFMRPALDEDGPQALLTLGTELGKGIERVAARLAGPRQKTLKA